MTAASISAAIAAALLTVLPGLAAAEGPPATDVAGVPPPARLDAAGLDAQTAGADGGANIVSSQQVTATNSGNSVNADTVQSGDIAFSDSAFSGFNGIGNFVFNTGANNNVQGVVSVNIVGDVGP